MIDLDLAAEQYDKAKRAEMEKYEAEQRARDPIKLLEENMMNSGQSRTTRRLMRKDLRKRIDKVKRQS